MLWNKNPSLHYNTKLTFKSTVSELFYQKNCRIEGGLVRKRIIPQAFLFSPLADNPLFETPKSLFIIFIEIA
jgi:hypothetical protein